MREDKEEVVQENGQLILFPKKEWDSLVKWEPVAKLDPYEVYSDLDGKAMLCYENADQFCHRHIVAARDNSRSFYHHFR